MLSEVVSFDRLDDALRRRRRAFEAEDRPQIRRVHLAIDSNLSQYVPSFRRFYDHAS